MTKKPLALSGVYTAIVTPFLSDGSVDIPAFKHLIDLQLEAGVQGLVICGSTGEAATMSQQEQLALIDVACTHVNGRTTMIAGAGSNNTHHAIDMQRALKALPIDATLHVVPYYNKPTQEGLYRHFKAITEASDIPVILYNVPSRTVIDMAPATVVRLVKDCPSIVAIKEANENMQRFQGLYQSVVAVRPDFVFLTGDDGTILPFMAIGGQGVISVISNFCPKETVELCAAMNRGDLLTARRVAARLSEFINLMFFRGNPVPIKCAMAFKGWLKPHFRLPLCELVPEDSEFLRKRLTQEGWL